MSKVELKKEVEVKQIISTADRELLDQAIANYHSTVADVNNHRLELDKLQGQINELNNEIARLQSVEFNMSADLSIQNIKNFANEKYKARLELETLIDIRDKLSQKLPKLSQEYNYIDCTAESVAKRQCWSVLYAALLSVIDVEPIKQLLAVGVSAGMSEKRIMDELNLTVEYMQLEPLVDMFGIPHDE